ncbi:hypothetical protein PHPALM_7899, partial [Phytophthora palmivora]
MVDLEDDHYLRNLLLLLLSIILAHECEFRQLGCPEPNSKEWKLLKRQDDLSVYKQRANGEHSDSNKSSKTYTVKCVGTLEGTLEDILYGTHSKNRDEMHATAPLVACVPRDACTSQRNQNPKTLVLHDTNQTLFKITETFGDARLVWVFDAWGHRYGYFLAKFADHPGCPPMPEDSDVIRGKMAICCIYRQQPGAKIVDVYAKGSIDLGVAMPAFVTSDSSCEMMFSMAISEQSAEAK